MSSLWWRPDAGAAVVAGLYSWLCCLRWLVVLRSAGTGSDIACRQCGLACRMGIERALCGRRFLPRVRSLQKAAVSRPSQASEQIGTGSSEQQFRHPKSACLLPSNFIQNINEKERHSASVLNQYTILAAGHQRPAYAPGMTGQSSPPLLLLERSKLRLSRAFNTTMRQRSPLCVSGRQRLSPSQSYARSPSAGLLTAGRQHSSQAAG